MSEFYYPATLTRGNGIASVTAFNVETGEVFQANENHPRWNEILDGLRWGHESVWGLFNLATAVMSRMQAVTERISYNGSEVLFDGDPVHSALSAHLERAIVGGNVDDYTAVAKFWEKLETNPNEHSRTQAYDWLACHEFQITENGDVVGYKGVNDNGDGTYTSGWSSAVADVPSGFVNGVPVPPLSRIPQKIGDVVSMPRNEVAHDPTQACKRGLHVATYGYAAGYGTVLEVHVNPRDIVSVPTDANGAKVRVCRYTVARVASKQRSNEPVLHSNNVQWTPDVSYRV